MVSDVGFFLDALFDRGDGVDHRGMVSVKGLSNGLEGFIRVDSAQEHGDLTRVGDRPFPRFRFELFQRQVEIADYALFDVLDGDRLLFRLNDRFHHFPGQAHIYHAWESYQFEGGVSHQALTASPIKVTQLVGDYGQLHWGYAHYEPNQIDRDTRVEVELYEG